MANKREAWLRFWFDLGREVWITRDRERDLIRPIDPVIAATRVALEFHNRCSATACTAVALRYCSICAAKLCMHHTRWVGPRATDHCQAHADEVGGPDKRPEWLISQSAPVRA